MDCWNTALLQLRLQQLSEVVAIFAVWVRAIERTKFWLVIFWDWSCGHVASAGMRLQGKGLLRFWGKRVMILPCLHNL